MPFMFQCSLGLLLEQLQTASTLGPGAGRRILDYFLESHRRFADRSNDTEILAQIVSKFHPIEIIVGGFDQREANLLLLKRADHLKAFQRERLKRFLAPVQIRPRPAAAS